RPSHCGWAYVAPRSDAVGRPRRRRGHGGMVSAARAGRAPAVDRRERVVQPRRRRPRLSARRRLGPRPLPRGAPRRGRRPARRRARHRRLLPLDPRRQLRVGIVRAALRPARRRPVRRRPLAGRRRHGRRRRRRVPTADRTPAGLMTERRPDRRVDPRSGAPVVITGTRQDRPNLPAGACPFCPGGLEAPAPYTVRSFVNRWPPLPDGRAEILLYSPRHDASLCSLGVDGARAVVDLWADRTAALGTRDDVAYVLVFENRGAEVGATIPHPHGQLYVFDAVPPVAARELAAGTCPVCAEDARDRLV